MSASDRFARAVIGIETWLRRVTWMAGASATNGGSGVPSLASRRRALRPAERSAARADGASTTTSCPRARSASAAPATCSFTGCGFDHANGVTMHTRRLRSIWNRV